MTSKAEINPDRLPPTERTAYYHTSRGTLETVFTNYDFAPDSLLNFTRCKCKTECTSKKCSCRKHGLKCVTAYGDCRGNCTNSKVLVALKLINFAGTLFRD